MAFNSSLVKFGFVLTIFLQSTSLAQPIRSSEKDTELLNALFSKSGKIRPGMLSDIFGRTGTIRPGMLPEMKDYTSEEFKEESMEENSISTEISYENDENTMKVVKLLSESDLSLNDIKNFVKKRLSRHHKKSNIIIKCYKCTVN